jgi:hypothetical protein
VICAVLIVRTLPTALASLAAILDRSKFGIAIAATTKTPAASIDGLALTSRMA